MWQSIHDTNMSHINICTIVIDIVFILVGLEPYIIWNHKEHPLCRQFLVFSFFV